MKKYTQLVRKKQFSLGFTLIELLVVVAIIAVLAALVIIRIASGSADARNSRRLSDLNQVRSAIERYKAEGGECSGTQLPPGRVLGKTVLEIPICFPGCTPYFSTPTNDMPSSYLSSGKTMGGEYPEDPQPGKEYRLIDTTPGGCDYTLTAEQEPSGTITVSH